MSGKEAGGREEREEIMIRISRSERCRK